MFNFLDRARLGDDHQSHGEVVAAATNARRDGHWRVDWMGVHVRLYAHPCVLGECVLDKGAVELCSDF